MSDIIAIPGGMFQAVSYLIHLNDACCLIDPAIRPAAVPSGMPPVNRIVATHGHIDHICQADAWRQAFPAPLWIHPDDRDCLIDANRNLSASLLRPMVFQAAEHCLADGEILQLDETHALEVLHTPGHTPGCICLLLLHEGKPAGLFTGDTLFAGSIGRLDFIGGDQAAMTRSMQRLQFLASRAGCADMPVYPGHGPSTSLRRELSNNPYLRELIG